MTPESRSSAAGDDRRRAVYVISVAAELVGMHAQTLRVYERKGLLSPARTSGGSRRYSDHDLALLARIAALTDEGLNLAGVKRVLELEARVAALQRELADVTERAAATVAETHRQYRRDLVPTQPGAIVPASRPEPFADRWPR